MARLCFIGSHSTGGFEKIGIALGNRAALTAQLFKDRHHPAEGKFDWAFDKVRERGTLTAL